MHFKGSGHPYHNPDFFCSSSELSVQYFVGHLNCPFIILPHNIQLHVLLKKQQQMTVTEQGLWEIFQQAVKFR